LPSRPSKIDVKSGDHKNKKTLKRLSYLKKTLKSLIQNVEHKYTKLLKPGEEIIE